MDEVSIQLAIGQHIDGARHFCGMRRSGLHSPDCPGCGTTMLCIFSLDGLDPAIVGTDLGRYQGDWDFFVCPACPIDLYGYYTRTLESGEVELRFDGPRREAFERMVLPYPVCPILLEPRPMASRPKGLEKEVRVQPSGSYHLLTSHLRWGNLERSEACPFCGGRMIQAAIIDSDDRLDLRAEKGEPSGISLNWADGNYLAVSRCRSCRSLGYHVAFS